MLSAAIPPAIILTKILTHTLLNISIAKINFYYDVGVSLFISSRFNPQTPQQDIFTGCVNHCKVNGLLLHNAMPFPIFPGMPQFSCSIVVCGTSE
jgi:hypothetical protein